jgi:hypothetical protein
MKYNLLASLACFFFLIQALTSQNENLNIYLDCQMRCHYTYVKENIQFVNYMQDRYTADIYILATSQQAGSGGREIQLSFTGNGDFENIQDTIIYFTEPDLTDVLYRELLVKKLKQGLLKFIVQTALITNVDFSVSKENEASVEESDKDPWNYWVFNVGGHGNMNGEESFSRIGLHSYLSGSRITDQSKFTFSLRHNYSREKYVLSDDEEYISTITSYNNQFRYVKSVNEHWSLGALAGGGSSSFSNTDVEAYFRPAVEFNIYPYEKSSTQRFSFMYSIGPEHKNYADTTIFEKISETVIRQSLNIEFEQTQKWGSLELDLGFSQYLHDLELYSMFINPNLEWSIFKGFRIEFGGYLSFVGDRINIAKSELSDEEILLQTRQLDTDYSYYTYIGINYRFGSQFNNFVNPRF